MAKMSKGFLQSKPNFFEGLEIDLQNVNKELPERVLQFGEGNFLRAFVDYFIDELNQQGHFNGRIAVVQPIAHGLADELNAQDGCYTVILRGLENNMPIDRRRVITSVSRAINPYSDFESYMAIMANPDLRFIVSNTTEAGIAYVETDKLDDKPPASFPAKVTALLYERYKIFNGDPSKGFIFIPCELIDNNGDNLCEIVLRHANNWNLPQEFVSWVKTANEFTNTLVDRIVTGYPKDEIETFEKELGYKDDLLVTGEIFHFFAIEARKEWTSVLAESLPFPKIGLNAVFTEDVTPYKLRKVRILNGAHTMSVLAAFLAGKNTVGEMMDDPQIAKYLKSGIYDEIIPTLDLDKKDLESFAASVSDRFANPHIKHFLLSIALNSVAKYKARVLPSILEYHKRTGKLPEMLTFSFAALLAFYKGTEIRDNALIGMRGTEEYKIMDDMNVLEFFRGQWQKNDVGSLVTATCAQTAFWDMNLNQLPGFSEKVTAYLNDILKGKIFQW